MEGDCTNGQGVWKYDDGANYKGEFKEGVPHGKGKEIIPTGAVKAGEWTSGKKEGVFTVVGADGKEMLREYYNDGEFLFQFEGKINAEGTGKGKIYYTDGSFYEGDLVKFFREGKGKIVWKSKKTGPVDARYEGGWVGGKLSGQGTFVNSKGSVMYSGRWWDGKNQIGNLQSRATYYLDVYLINRNHA